eukprot:TRINITY_DN3759_c0_g2_i2.p1 TRINITY_DN3759_c0_g2~~TRINITY_DN3759_c0_g2_i2.p1  ORF type:complete len:420 (+),score=49.57 TRINITY_DN3759_c0_g2_i2:109-1368(+)
MLQSAVVSKNVAIQQRQRQTVYAQLNPVVTSLNPSKTMQLTDLANELKAKGKDVLGLAAGEPDFDTPMPAANAGISAIQEGWTHYGPNVGYAELRQAIVDKLWRENGLKYEVDQVIVTNGAKQAIWQAVIATCGKGDEVIIPAPYWVSYPEMVKLAGATPVVLETTLRSGFTLQIDQLEQSITERTRMIILCSPSNPTGVVYPPEQLQAIAEVVKRFPNLLVLSDEIYEYIIYEGHKHVSFGTLKDMMERTITVNGFSKAYAMTGWRMGYLAAPKSIAKACATIQSHTTSGASSIAQKAALVAIQNCSNDVEAMREQFEARKSFVVEKLRKMNGVQFVVPGGAFYVLVDVSQLLGGVANNTRLNSADDLCRYILEEAMVAVVPGTAFGAPQCIRISFAVGMDVLSEALDRIDVALRQIE